MRAIQLEQPVFLESHLPLTMAIALMMGKEKGSPQSCLVITEKESFLLSYPLPTADFTEFQQQRLIPTATA